MIYNVLTRGYRVLHFIVLTPFKIGIIGLFAYMFGLDISKWFKVFDVFKINIPQWTFIQYLKLHLNWMKWWKKDVGIDSITIPDEDNDYNDLEENKNWLESLSNVNNNYSNTNLSSINMVGNDELYDDPSWIFNWKFYAVSFIIIAIGGLIIYYYLPSSDDKGGDTPKFYNGSPKSTVDDAPVLSPGNSSNSNSNLPGTHSAEFNHYFNNPPLLGPKVENVNALQNPGPWNRFTNWITSNDDSLGGRGIPAVNFERIDNARHKIAEASAYQPVPTFKFLNFGKAESDQWPETLNEQID